VVTTGAAASAAAAAGVGGSVGGGAGHLWVTSNSGNQYEVDYMT
jgi:hypothetical protein